jgi:hypothetical protein
MSFLMTTKALAYKLLGERENDVAFDAKKSKEFDKVGSVGSIMNLVSLRHENVIDVISGS